MCASLASTLHARPAAQQIAQMDAKSKEAAEGQDQGLTNMLQQVEAAARQLGLGVVHNNLHTNRTSRKDDAVKYDADELVLGLPPDAGRGVAAFVNYPGGEPALMRQVADGLAAIIEEIEQNGSEEEKECRDYVLNEEAGTSDKKFQNDWKRDCDTETGLVLAERQIADVSASGGKRGMRFADFCTLAIVVFCQLSEAEVFSVRYYTTWGFRGINSPLRDLTRREKKEPHKLGVLVFILTNAIKKLRAWAANAPDAYTAVDLFRGMSNRKIFDRFMQQGGTELAPMSTTADLSIALKYSQGGNIATLLWLRTENFMDRGVDLTWISAFPHEREFLYSPLCYLKPIQQKPAILMVGTSTYQIVELKASM